MAILIIIIIIFFYSACLNLIEVYKVSPNWAFIIGLFASWIADGVITALV
jgi:hypothetical protein